MSKFINKNPFSVDHNGIQSNFVACHKYIWCIFKLFTRNCLHSRISLLVKRIGDWFTCTAHVFDTELYNWNLFKFNLCEYGIFLRWNECWARSVRDNNVDARWKPGKLPSWRNLPDPGRECIVLKLLQNSCKKGQRLSLKDVYVKFKLLKTETEHFWSLSKCEFY